ncbi:MAG: cellulase family glycosylhydrolase [Anaerolineales bacterium]|nr:cellulase family glycosylhydrolase [Anaerolineales bacterium]
MKLFQTLICVFLVMSLPACNFPLTDEPAPATSTPQPPATVSPTTKTPPEHHIGIQVVNGVGKFFNRATGNDFVPRGMNYIRLAQQTKMDGSSTFGHALFDPGKYDSTRVAGDLQKMHADGYNVIRVFLSPDTMGTVNGRLSSAYMKNIADLLAHAKQNQIYVMFTLDWIPGGKYGSILSADCCSTFALMNANFLPPAGLKANQVFYQDFIRGLLELNAPTEYIFSYQLRNEMFYDTDQPPLSFSSGMVKTANGISYDMSKPTDKDLMVKQNLVYWLDEMRASILEVDPSALVSVGFFHPQKPNPARLGDPRLAVTEPAIWRSTIDFVDLHAYPGFELNLKQHVENYGVNGMEEKPIIMGEFGGEISRFASIQAAAQAFINWQVESCTYGFDGWIFWTWDLTEQPDFFNALMNDGAVNGVLAPVTRPDPCSP